MKTLRTGAYECQVLDRLLNFYELKNYGEVWADNNPVYPIGEPSPDREIRLTHNRGEREFWIEQSTLFMLLKHLTEIVDYREDKKERHKKQGYIEVNDTLFRKNEPTDYSRCHEVSNRLFSELDKWAKIKTVWSCACDRHDNTIPIIDRFVRDLLKLFEDCLKYDMNSVDSLVEKKIDELMFLEDTVESDEPFCRANLFRDMVRDSVEKEVKSIILNKVIGAKA